MNLFEIDNEILSCVDQETGEIIDTDKLDELTSDRDSKIENIACWIKNLNAEAKALQDQKMEFAKRQKTAENQAEKLKKYLTDYLQGQKFETSKVKISYRKSSSVEVSDITLLDAEYLTTPEPVPNKTAIKDALSSGTVVPGACIVIKENIQIR